MTTSAKLTLIKIIHTLIWIFFNVVIFYLLYAVLANVIDKWVWICLAAIACEGLVLLIFKNICPVTIWARNYSTSKSDNFDIFLPNWLARYNKQIYSVIVAVIVLILLYRLLS